jgi:hypothetical protein
MTQQFSQDGTEWGDRCADGGSFGLATDGC